MMVIVFKYSTIKRNQLNTDSCGFTEINRHCLINKINVIMIFCHSILFLHSNDMGDNEQAIMQSIKYY